MEASAKHFINPQLLAPNVVEVDVPLDLLAPVLELAPHIQQLTRDTRRAALPGGLSVDIMHPANWHSDILWITQGDEPTYRHFERLFDQLGVAAHVARHIELNDKPRLYTAMFVSRSFCSEAYMHRDWIDTNNDAFTFLTPITPNHRDIGLVYRDIRGETRAYEYRMGKGVIFGDHFYHSTAPGRSDQPAVLLAFQFGTDRMDRWDRMLASAYQGGLHCRPDGTLASDPRFSAP